jgi:tetratricopeptide (TPR) repeat protein
LGKSYAANGETLKAIEILDRAWQIDPSNSTILNELIKGYLEIGDFQKAGTFIELSLQIDANNSFTHLLDAHLKISQEDFEAAQRCTRKVLALDPLNTDAIILLSRTLEKCGDNVQSLSVIEDALEKIPSSGDILFEYSNILITRAGAKVSLPVVRDAAERFSDDARFWCLVAKLEKECGEIDKSESAARRALDLEPESPEMRFLLGQAKYMKGDLDQAIQFLTETITLDAKMIEAFMLLANVYYERREHTKALGIYEKAIENFPDDFRPFYHAALIFREMKEYLNAERLLRKAVDLAPQDVNIRRQLGAVIALNLVHNSQEAGYRL